MKLEKFSEGDSILFSDRKQPLEVEEVTEDSLIVEGPSGGEYEIYEDEGTLLFCKKGNRKYSSYCKDLRKVGEWKKEGYTWRHSKSGREIWIEKNQVGYWTIESEDFDLEELDIPRYGYSDRETAEEEVEKFLSKNPEG